ncbi:MAG TPA: ASCH domain-containing protein [Candidatus Limnocylindrales bacterium]
MSDPEAGIDPAGLPRWGFADPGELRDELTAAALDGRKTTTASLLVEYAIDGDALPVPGQRDVLLDSDERPVAIVETIDCRIVRLADVDDRHAIDEGEGYADAAEFRVAHERYWNGYIDRIRAGLGDPTFELTDDTMIVLERLRIVERLDGRQPA